MERSAQAIIHKLAQIDAQDQRSTIVSTPIAQREPTQDAEALTTGSAAYVPRRVYEAPAHIEPIALRSRRIWNNRAAAVKGRAKDHFWQEASIAQGTSSCRFFGSSKGFYSYKIPSSSKVSYQDSERFWTQSASARSEQGRTQKQVRSNPPQDYTVKPPPPQVAKAASPSAATSKAGPRFRSPPRRPQPVPPPPVRPVPPKELTIAPPPGDHSGPCEVHSGIRSDQLDRVIICRSSS